MADIPQRLLRRYFNGHVPRMWPIEHEDLRQLVGLAHEAELLAGAQIDVTQSGIAISIPKAGAPQDA